MFVFAFPGMGKTTLAQRYRHVVDLELSDIKYDNTSVSHLTKEERKSTKRPIKDKKYRKTYVDKAFALHDEGKTVLVALNFFLRIFFRLLLRRQLAFHIFIPHPSLKEEYRQRYLLRGNNARFIFEVLAIWYPTTLFLWLFSKIFPRFITVTKTGETLEDHYQQARQPIFATIKRKQATVL